jgi:hypothetical protein
MSFSAPLTGPDRLPIASVNIGQPIDTGGTAAAKDPDTVNLKVDALYLFKAVPPTGSFGGIGPVGIIAQLTLTDGYPLAELFSGPGTYNSWYRLTHPGDGTKGAYGFHVAGSKSFSCPGGTPQPLAASSFAVPRAASAGRPRMRDGHPTFPGRCSRGVRAE